MIPKIFILVVIISTVSAAVWRGYPPEKPKHLAHKEGCYIKEVGDVIAYGETITPIGNCVRIHCTKTMIDYASCGVVVGTRDSKCYVTEIDLSKPYPRCCPTIKCISDNIIF